MMKIFFKAANSYLLLLIACSCNVMAEFGRPVLGHIPGANPQALIRIDGIPGAAQARPSHDATEALEWIAISPEQNYAIAIRSADHAVTIVRLDREPREAQPLYGCVGSDRIILSPNGATAAIYSQAAGSIQIIGGLPDSPVYRRSISSAALRNSIRSLAVSDDGSVVLASNKTEAHELMVATDKGIDIVSLSEPIVDIVFRPHRPEAVILTDRRVFIAAEFTNRTRLDTMAGTEQGLIRPAAAEFSRDGRRIYIADPGARGIHILTVGLSTATTVSCGCSASELQRLNGKAVFWLNTTSDGMTRIFDGDVAEPRVLIVPHMPASN